MNRVYLVDKNSVCRAWHCATTLKTSTGIETQAVMGIITTLLKIKSIDKNNKIMVLDDGHATFRYEIYPEYKGNRAPKDEKAKQRNEAYYAQAPFIDKALDALGVMKVRAENYEADDLAGWICTKNNQQKFTLVSSDKDWLILLSPNVDWFDMRANKLIELKTLVYQTNSANPEAFLMKKALMGDPSDNIKGVGGFGEKRATEVSNKYGTLDNLLGHFSDEDMKKAWFKKLVTSEEMHEIYRRNIMLMDIRHKYLPNILMETQKSVFDENKFLELCSELEFNSFISQILKFKELFNAK